ncbi:MAG: prolipoprotein diacylglyceryl transferase [Methyloligellaceae bacterium]
MSVLAIPYHNIDPVALDLGFFSIRWYGLAYLSGLMLGWFYIRKLISDAKYWGGTAPMDKDAADDLLIWITFGVVLGGRLGFVLFYEPLYFIGNPLDAFKIWQGGMSFHGGLLGTAFAIYLFSRRYKVSLFSTADLVAAAVPIGIFFGRIANFINGGLYGRVSDVPWAMPFPAGGDQPRHPSQLYEAFLEGIVVFFLLRFLIFNRLALAKPGLIAGTFLVSYAIGRSISEIFRQSEDGHLLNWGPFTAGMVYSIPMALFGIYFIVQAVKQQRVAA